MVQEKIVSLLPGSSLARQSLVGTNARFSIDKKMLTIYSPLTMSYPKKPIYKSKKAFKEFKKTVTEELKKYVPGMIKSVDDDYDFSLRITLNQSFMDSLKV